MTQPSRPVALHQGPATACKIDGGLYGWLNCTPTAMAMGIDKTSLGAHQPSGCTVRRYTLDKFGGTTLPQVATVAKSQYGLSVEMHTGSTACSPRYLAAECRKGRGFVLQGNTHPLLGTRFKSTNGGVNHAVWVNEVRGEARNGDPEGALVYDPAADGRRDMDDSPSWWPWDLVEAFAAALHPWGEADPRTLGKGRAYAGLMGDTEPHVHVTHGGTKTKPFPDRTRAVAPKGRRVRVHSVPSSSDQTVVDTLADGDLFVAYQVTRTGESFHGSRVWYGNHDGDGWIHEARLSHEGGTT